MRFESNTAKSFPRSISMRPNFSRSRGSSAASTTLACSMAARRVSVLLASSRVSPLSDVEKVANWPVRYCRSPPLSPKRATSIFVSTLRVRVLRAMATWPPAAEDRCRSNCTCRVTVSNTPAVACSLSPISCLAAAPRVRTLGNTELTLSLSTQATMVAARFKMMSV